MGAFGYLTSQVTRTRAIAGQVQRATADSTFTLTEGDWRANNVSRSRLMEDRLGIANRPQAAMCPC